VSSTKKESRENPRRNLKNYCSGEGKDGEGHSTFSVATERKVKRFGSTTAKKTARKALSREGVDLGGEGSKL